MEKNDVKILKAATYASGSAENFDVTLADDKYVILTCDSSLNTKKVLR